MVCRNPTSTLCRLTRLYDSSTCPVCACSTLNCDDSALTSDRVTSGCSLEFDPNNNTFSLFNLFQYM